MLWVYSCRWQSWWDSDRSSESQIACFLPEDDQRRFALCLQSFRRNKASCRNLYRLQCHCFWASIRWSQLEIWAQALLTQNRNRSRDNETSESINGKGLAWDSERDLWNWREVAFQRMQIFRRVHHQVQKETNKRGTCCVLLQQICVGRQEKHSPPSGLTVDQRIPIRLWSNLPNKANPPDHILSKGKHKKIKDPNWMSLPSRSKQQISPHDTYIIYAAIDTIL